MISSLALPSLPMVISENPGVAVEWFSVGSGTRPRIIEVSVTATTNVVGFGYASTRGVHPIAVPFGQEDPGNPPSQMAGAVRWGTKPDAPLIYIRRIIGMCILTFPRGLTLPIGGSFVGIRIGTSTSIFNTWCVVDE